MKQEFCSSLNPCQYGYADETPTEWSRSEQNTDFILARETNNFMSNCVQSRPPYYISTPAFTPQAEPPKSLVKLESQHCTLTEHSFNGYPCEAKPWPIHQPSSPAFPPWGLAEEPESSGTTFGSLAGVDMSQSLAEGAGLSEDEKKATPTKGKSRHRRVKREEEEDDGWEPPLWRQQLQNISKMREIRDAPVDLMGAHKNAEQTTHVAPEVNYCVAEIDT